MRRWAAVVLCMGLVSGCGVFGADRPVAVSPSPYDPPVRKNPPVSSDEIVVATPKRITDVAPCSVVGAVDVAHWVGKGTARPDGVGCYLDGERGRVNVFLGANVSVWAASQVALGGDLGHEEFVRGNSAWVEPREKLNECAVFVAVSVSRKVSALLVKTRPGLDCGLAQEVAATVVDRLPPGPDPDERFDPSLHPTPTPVVTPTR